jgi:DNA polymerase-3 subunit delta
LLRVWYGEDAFSQGVALADLREKLGGVDLGPGDDLLLDGAKLVFDELKLACQALPFLGSHRLVVVDGLLNRFELEKRRRGRRKPKKLGEWEKLAAYIPEMTSTTELILRDGGIEKSNPLLRSLADVAEVRAFTPPKGRDVQGWVRARVKDGGGSISSGAIRMLAEFIGGDLWLMSKEIDKLLSYANGNAIDEEAVRRLVNSVQSANIFHLVDAVVEGRARPAVRLLGELRHDGVDDTQILTMVTRQFRGMFRIKGLTGKGLNSSEVRKGSGIRSDWEYSKTLAQARNYSEADLKRAYHQLLEADLGLKTSDAFALEKMILDLCRV